MHVGLNYIYPFYLLRVPLSPAVLGRGLVKGLGQTVAGLLSGLWVPAMRPLTSRTAASLAQAHLFLAALQAPNELSSARPGR